MSLRPELNVKLVIEADSVRDKVNARNSVIYHVDEETLILAQTEPSIRRSMLNKEIVVTYLVKKNDTHLRYGFSALVTDLVDQYELSSEQRVRAIAVRKRSDPKPYDIRMCYRVGPSSKSGLDASIYDEKITVIDISLGGMRFSYRKSLPLGTDKVIDVHLALADRVYTIKARIIRTWEAELDRFGTELRFGAAEFLNVSGKIEQELTRKILDIEREPPFVASKVST